MQLVYTLPDALEALAAQKLPPDNTLALLPLGDSFYPEDALSVTLAKKYTDLLVAVALGKNQAFDRATLHRIAEAGVGLFIAAKPTPTAVELTEVTPFIHSTFYLQTILAVMPSVVVVHPHNLPLLKVTRSLESTFPQLFTLMEPEAALTPTHSVGYEILQALQVVQNMVQSGELMAQNLLQAAADALQTRGFHTLHELALYDKATLNEVNLRLGQAAYLFAVVERDGQRYKQLLLIITR